MVSKLCSRSQGHPPGARKRAMMATARSNLAPVDTKLMYHSAHSTKNLSWMAANTRDSHTRFLSPSHLTAARPQPANSVVNLNFVSPVRHLLEESYLIQDCCWTFESFMSPTSRKQNSLGYVTFALHSHLPYVVNHGTWPHGMEWLHEAAAETYLPLLRVFSELEQEGLSLKANVNLSPILLEQLAHPVFKDEFPKYLLRKVKAAHKDAEEFALQGEQHMVQVARFWQHFYEQSLRQFDDLGSDIISGFRRFYES